MAEGQVLGKKREQMGGLTRARRFARVRAPENGVEIT
jgi:hypothetical protein